MSDLFDIYLSSTLDDLRPERDAVLDVLTVKNALSVKQSYSASERELVGSCQDDVAQSCVYVAIVGLRYGYRPVEPDGNPGAKSITELEFDAAQRAGIPCFVFLKSTDHILAIHTDRNAGLDSGAIDRFRARLSSGQRLRPGLFATVAELRESILALAGELREAIRRRRGSAAFIPRLGRAPRIAFDHVERRDALNALVGKILGAGSIGKTTLAQMACADAKVQAAFSDGVVWITLGQRPVVLSVLNDRIAELLTSAGDRLLRYTSTTNIDAAARHFESILAERRLLLVIDDVWSASDLVPFLFESSSCRVLITSRDVVAVSAVGADVVQAEVMSPAESIEVLRRHVLAASPSEEALRTLAAELGHLPLALDLAGRRLADGYPLPKLLKDLRSEIERLDALDRDLAGIEADEGLARNLSLNASFNLSLRQLPDALVQAFSCLGACVEDAMIVPSFAAVLWDVDETTARQQLLMLCQKSLLQRASGTEFDDLAFNLHDLLHAKARELLHGGAAEARRSGTPCLGLSTASVHDAVVHRLKRKLGDRPWCDLPPDGYIEHHLLHHLLRAGTHEEVLSIFSPERLRAGGTHATCGWYEFRDRQGDVAAFLTDLAQARDLATQHFTAHRGTPQADQCLGRVVQLSAFLGSVNDQGSALTVPLVEMLVEMKVWSAATLLAHARRHLAPGKIARFAARTGGEAGEALLAVARWKANARRDGSSRWEALLEIVAERPQAPDVLADLRESLRAALPAYSPQALRTVDAWDKGRIADLGAFLLASARLIDLNAAGDDGETRSLLRAVVFWITGFFTKAQDIRLLANTKALDAEAAKAWCSEHRGAIRRAMAASMVIDRGHRHRLPDDAQMALRDWARAQVEAQLSTASLELPFVGYWIDKLPDLERPVVLLDAVRALGGDWQVRWTSTDLSLGFRTETMPLPSIDRLPPAYLESAIDLCLVQIPAEPVVKVLARLAHRLGAPLTRRRLIARLDGASSPQRLALLHLAWLALGADSAHDLWRAWRGTEPSLAQTSMSPEVVSHLCALAPVICRDDDDTAIALARCLLDEDARSRWIDAASPHVRAAGRRALAARARDIHRPAQRLRALGGLMAAEPGSDTLTLEELSDAATRVDDRGEHFRIIGNLCRKLPPTAQVRLLALALAAATEIQDAGSMRSSIALCAGTLPEPLRSALINGLPICADQGDYQGFERIATSGLYERRPCIGSVDDVLAQHPLAPRGTAPEPGRALSSRLRTECAVMALTDDELREGLLKTALDPEYISRQRLFSELSGWLVEMNHRGLYDCTALCTVGLRAAAVWWP